MMSMLRKIFSKDVDKQVDHIFDEDIKKPLQQSTAVGKDLNELLVKNGITFQIYVSSRGENVLGGKHGNS